MVVVSQRLRKGVAEERRAPPQRVREKKCGTWFMENRGWDT